MRVKESENEIENESVRESENESENKNESEKDNVNDDYEIKQINYCFKMIDETKSFEEQIY